MARVQELSDLFRAIAASDTTSVLEHARAIVDSEQKSGHVRVAATLAGALHGTAGGRAETLWHDRLDRLVPDSLTRLPDTVGMAEVELTAAARNTVEEQIQEYRMRERLQHNNIPPRTALLFHGPPGSGKTLTARCIGAELGLPVYVVRLDSIVGSLLGQTAGRISEVFRFAEAELCVLLLDEIDVLGRHRGQSSDVRELDRVVVTLMQQLDLTKPAGIVIATTNMMAHLDRALVRRFQLMLEFPIPTPVALDRFVANKAKQYGLRPTKKLMRTVLGAESYAAAEEIIIQVRRAELLKRR